MIRSATYDDIPQLVSLLNDLNQNTLYSYSDVLYDNNIVNRNLTYKKINNEPYFVCVDNNKLLGFGTWFPFYFNIPDSFGPKEKMVEITIGVHKQFRRSGVGRLINDALINYAMQNNLNSIWAGCIEGNENALNFFKKNGYKYSIVLENFKPKFGKYRDLNLLQKTVC